MPRHRMMLAAGLAAAVAATAIVISLTFANDSAAAEAGTSTVRVSVDTDEHQSTHDSGKPAISADGRYVAFATDEPFDPVDKLAASDVYVRDTVLGTTTLISHGVETDGQGNTHVVSARGPSDQPSISGDGRFVAFRTDAANIAPQTQSVGMIVVCDRDPGGTGELNSTCAFTKISGDDVDPDDPHLSADGRRIAYDLPPATVVSFAPAPPSDDVNPGWVEVVNLRPGEGPPRDDDRTYVTAPPHLTIGGTDHLLDLQSDSTMAAGGGHVAFVARYLHSDDPAAAAVYDYNVDTAALTRLDLDASGDPIAADGRLFSHPALSGDGRRYAFADAQENTPIGVRLYDRGPALGSNPTVESTSRKTDGSEGVGALPAFSADGRYLAFTTPSPGMHNGTDDSDLESSCLGAGVSTHCDVVVRDVMIDHDRAAAGLPRLPAELASPSVNCTAKPCEGTGESGSPESRGARSAAAVLSADGSFVAYGSEAEDLVDGDTNVHPDVFRHQFIPALAGDPQDFGVVPLGAQSVRAVPLTHVGAGPLQVTALTVAGADFDVFPGEACTTVTLHATEKCAVSVRFKPTVLGPRTATLQVTIRGVETPLTIALTGTGVAAPIGVLTAGPDRLDFGTRTVLGTSPNKSVTVRNTGTAPLVIGAVTLGAPTATTFPGDYRKVADTCANKTLAPGGGCRIDIRHRPTAVGVRPAVLTVAYASTLTFPVTLTGAGATPTLVSSPTVTPAGRVIQITGTGFPAGCTAKLSLTGMPGTTTAKARADGTFRVPFVVLPNTWTGKHPLTADVLPATAPGLSAPLNATLDFVIVPGSPVPPDFNIRK